MIDTFQFMFMIISLYALYFIFNPHYILPNVFSVLIKLCFCQ